MTMKSGSLFKMFNYIHTENAKSVSSSFVIRISEYVAPACSHSHPTTVYLALSIYIHFVFDYDIQLYHVWLYGSSAYQVHTSVLELHQFTFTFSYNIYIPTAPRCSVDGMCSVRYPQIIINQIQTRFLSQINYSQT